MNHEDVWRVSEKENWLRKRETGKKRYKRKVTVIKPTISKLQNGAKVSPVRTLLALGVGEESGESEWSWGGIREKMNNCDSANKRNTK